MKKRLLTSIVVVLILCFCLCSCEVDSTNNNNFGGNIGDTNNSMSNEQEAIQKICSASDLRKIEDKPDGNYILTCHIDLAEYGNWVPICLDDNPFTGTLDGDGYTIKNLNVDVVHSDDIDVAGLFGCVKGATFKNLGISGGKINISSDSYGGAAGAFAGASSAKSDNGEYILTSVSNCFVSAEVSSTRIENGNTSYGATMAIGSFFGVGCADFTNCYNTGEVAAASSYADQIIGGFIGNVYAYEEAPMTIECCYNLGLMSGRYIKGDKPGGFLGYPHYSSYADYVDIINSYYGSNANEYNTLRIAMTDSKDTDFTSVKSLSVDEMKNKDNYVGFDFENIWAISSDKNEGYPYLKIQK